MFPKQTTFFFRRYH